MGKGLESYLQVLLGIVIYLSAVDLYNTWVDGHADKVTMFHGGVGELATHPGQPATATHPPAVATHTSKV